MKVGDLVMCTMNWSPNSIGQRVGVVVATDATALSVLVDGVVKHLWKYEAEVISESRGFSKRSLAWW